MKETTYSTYEARTEPRYESADRYDSTNLVLDIRAKIAERQRLSESIKDTLLTIEVDLDNRILRASSIKPQTPSLIERRTALEQEILRCKLAVLNEEQQCWQDISDLEQQLRDALRQESILVPGGPSYATG